MFFTPDVQRITALNEISFLLVHLLLLSKKVITLCLNLVLFSDEFISTVHGLSPRLQGIVSLSFEQVAIFRKKFVAFSYFFKFEVGRRQFLVQSPVENKS